MDGGMPGALGMLLGAAGHVVLSSHPLLAVPPRAWVLSVPHSIAAPGSQHRAGSTA